MSEVVLKECPVCGRVFEDDSTRHNRKVCSASCAARRSHARRAAKRRRERVLKRRERGGDNMKSRDVYRFAETAVYIVFTAGWAFAIIAGACR
ncbi:MAG: hypothetical protein II823_06755 [Kiritimatiellae bacterium]|nr:hypothetical protein [Kiritimatiellia bacterium]